MDILWKSLAGAVVTAIIAWAAKQGDILPGVVPLFPTFTLIALVAVGTKGAPEAYQVTCLAALKTVPAYLVFLLANLALAPRFNYRVTLLLALGAWLLVAGAIFLGPQLLSRWHTQ